MLYITTKVYDGKKYKNESKNINLEIYLVIERLPIAHGSARYISKIKFYPNFISHENINFRDNNILGLGKGLG